MQSCQPDWDRLAEAVGKKPVKEKTAPVATQQSQQQNSMPQTQRRTVKHTSIW
jgi:hypothetical protein